MVPTADGMTRERLFSGSKKRTPLAPVNRMWRFCQQRPLWRSQKDLLSSIIIILAIASCAADAPPNCFTSKINNLMVTNCQGQGHKAIPNVDLSTEVLLLNFNFLSTILNSSFSRMNALRMLSLGRQLGGHLFVGERAFANVSNITFLDLGGNRNLSLHPRALYGLTKVEVLLLDVNGFDNRILEGGFFQDLLSLKRLDLTGNHIHQLRPDPTFQGLKKLSTLQLKLNNIGAICGNDLQHLSGRHLTLLDLSSNRLLSYPSCANPFCNITLGTLDISSNRWNVVEVKQFFSKLNGTQIQKLQMQHSGAIGSGFGFRNIKDISASTFSGLRHSGISTFDMSHGFLNTLVPSVFSNLPDLEILFLRFNQISKIQHRAFSGLKKLQVLDLSSNLLGEIYSETLQDLRSFPLQYLILKSNHIGVIEYNALMGLDFLLFLDLQDNALVRVPTGNLPSLLHLNLGQNRIKHAWGIEQLGKNLIRLDFSSNHLSDLGNVWGKVAKIPALRFLNLSNNHLDRCFRFENSPRQLTELDLSHNHLENIWKTGNCIDIFQHLEKLVILNLSSNHLRDLPGNLFQSLGSLEILNLSGNMLHRLPEQTFQGLKSLRTLSVRGNPLITLSPSLFQPMEQLKSLDLRELSLVCSCELTDFQTWLQIKESTVSGTEIWLTCIQTSPYFQQSLSQFLERKCVS